MTAERLIDLIEQRQLLPGRLVEKLRAKVATSDGQMSAAALLLIDDPYRQLNDIRAALKLYRTACALQIAVLVMIVLCLGLPALPR